MAEIKAADTFASDASKRLRTLADDTVTATTGRPKGGGTAETTPLAQFTVVASGTGFAAGAQVVAAVAAAGTGVNQALVNLSKSIVQLDRKLRDYAGTTNKNEERNTALSQKFR